MLISPEDYAMQLSTPQPHRFRFVHGALLVALLFCGAIVPPTRTTVALSAAPRILLVDDDTNDPDVRAYYTAALDGLGVAYDIWDTTTRNEPDSAALASYATVIWFTGRNGYPDQEADTALA